MHNILFISRDLSATHGRGVVSRNLADVLSGFNKLDVCNIDMYRSANGLQILFHKLYTFISSFFLYYGGNDLKKENKIIRKINKERYDIVFIYGSHYGRLIRRLKRLSRFPKIVVYIENIEVEFMNGLIKSNGFTYLPLRWAAYYNEKQTVEFADYIITMNSRDSSELFNLYHRNPDLEVPVFLHDRFISEKQSLESSPNETILLFVGSLFYSNLQGISWFVNEVMPYINAKLFIVGSNFEKEKDLLSRDNVQVLGSVESVDQYYYIADICVMPILSGTGMKVKTAEALMFGKTIVGSKEALIGYLDEKTEQYLYQCNSPKEYIDTISMLANKKSELRNNANSRVLFKKKYSFDSNREIIKNFIDAKVMQ